MHTTKEHLIIRNPLENGYEFYQKHKVCVVNLIEVE